MDLEASKRENRQDNTKYVNCFSKLFQLQSGICWDEFSFGFDHPYKVISVCGITTGSLIMTPYYNLFRLAMYVSNLK